MMTFKLSFQFISIIIHCRCIWCSSCFLVVVAIECLLVWCWVCWFVNYIVGINRIIVLFGVNDQIHVHVESQSAGILGTFAVTAHFHGVDSMARGVFIGSSDIFIGTLTEAQIELLLLDL